MNSFLEGLRSFRSRITRDVFQDKVFPLIALTNDLWKSKEAQQEVTSKSKAQETSALLYQLQNTDALKVPTIEWEKSLRPEGDQTYFEMLNSLTEKGVPVPLRALAAAVGLNLDKLLEGQKEDLQVRKQIAEFNKQAEKFAPSEEAAFASFPDSLMSSSPLTPHKDSFNPYGFAESITKIGRASCRERV